MTEPRSSLARHQLAEPASEAEIESMCRHLWHTKGKALIDPLEIKNAWVRRGVLNHIEAKYGERGSR